MFETAEFRKRIDTTVTEAALENGMLDYEKEKILDYLQGKAQENEPAAHEKIAAFLRDAGEAGTASSVRQLIKTVSIIARRANRTTLTEGDVELSLTMNFCKIWPFCKGK